MRQTVDCCLIASVCSGADVFGGGLRRSDRLDGSDAPGAASRDRRAPIASFAVRGRDRRGRTDRARRSARIAASAASMTRRRSSAAATACWCRSFCTISGGPDGGKWPCSIFRASPVRPTSSALWACRANRSGSSAVTFSSTVEDRPEVVAGDPGDADAGPRQPIPTSRCRPVSALAGSHRDARSRRCRERLDIERRPVRARAADQRCLGRDRLARLQALGPGDAAVWTGPRFLWLQRRRRRADNDVERPRHGSTNVRQRGRRCDLAGDAVRFRSVSCVRIPARQARSIELLRNNRPKSARKLLVILLKIMACGRETILVKRRSSIGACRWRSMGGCFLIRMISTIRVASGPASESPVALGVRGGAARGDRFSDLSGHLLHELAGQHAAVFSRDVDGGQRWGPDDYFVLGDNSPVSNDSRFWNEGPGGAWLDVRGEAVSGSSARAGCSAQGIRAVGVLGSRSAPNPLHSVDRQAVRRSVWTVGIRGRAAGRSE